MWLDGLTVGDLAHQTGLTVRTLYYYDEIGLLKPSRRTEAGYRVYTTRDLGRLQQVLLLRQFGFSLAEVRHCLDDPRFSATEVIRLHVAGLREQIELQKGLCLRLEATAAHLDTTSDVSADEFIRTIEVVIVMENHRTAEQKEYLKRYREHPREDHA